MPRLTKSLPKYRKHKRSGQAIVTIGGKDHYLGPYGTKASKLEYDRIISEWLAAGRELPENSPLGGLTVTELCARYWRFAKGHYRKGGKGTSELDNIRYALRPLRELYGRSEVAAFGPLALKTLQLRMIDDGLSRGVINSRIGKIKRVFRWAVSEELAPPSLMHALSTVMGLQKGRTPAREAEPVKPVADDVVDATLPFLPPVVADMVRFQRLTGCRPAEVCLIRPGDVDRTSDVWLYTPESHKTEHHGRSRIIAIGPKAQDVLRSYLLRDAAAYCFSPADSERKRKEQLRAERRTKVQPSQRDRSKGRAQRKPGDCYTTRSYLYAVTEFEGHTTGVIESLEDVFNDLAEAIVRLGHGGLLLITRNDVLRQFSSERTVNCRLLRQLLIRYWNDVATLHAARGGTDNSFAEVSQQEVSPYALAVSADTSMLENCVRSIANLAGMDGAIVINYGCNVIAFNAIISREADDAFPARLVDENGRELDPVEVGRNRGSRHQSAMSFARRVPNSFVFVISQDGGVTAFHNRGDGTVQWEGGLRVLD